METFLIGHWLDITTTLLGLAYILLEYRASVWLWPVGLVMQALGIVLYYQKGLYADCGMELYYICMTCYGLYSWTRHRHHADGAPAREKPITHMGGKAMLAWAGITAVIWATIYYLLAFHTDSRVPLADSFTTALSIVGIWALARKYLEQWIIWIAVDVVTCVLYFYKDIPFKASLYGLYVVIAIAGYRRWHRLMHAEGQPR